jgi:hypothetical protein
MGLAFGESFVAGDPPEITYSRLRQDQDLV